MNEIIKFYDTDADKPEDNVKHCYNILITETSEMECGIKQNKMEGVHTQILDSMFQSGSHPRWNTCGHFFDASFWVAFLVLVAAVDDAVTFAIAVDVQNVMK